MDLTRRRFLQVGGGLVAASALELAIADSASAATPAVTPPTPPKVAVKPAIDITQAPVADEVFAPFVDPNYPNSIQSFAFNVGAEQLFVAQNAGDPDDATNKDGANLGFSRYKLSSTDVSSTDFLAHAGHGAQIGIDHTAAGSFLWTGCTAAHPAAGSTVWGRSTQIGRFAFDAAEAGGASKANTVTAPDVAIFSPVHDGHDYSTAVDAKNRLLEVKYNVGYQTWFALYPLDKIVANRPFPAPLAKLRAPGIGLQAIAGHASYGNWHYDVQQTKLQRPLRVFQIRRTNYNTGATTTVLATIDLDVPSLEVEGIAIFADPDGGQSLYIGLSRPTKHTWALYYIPGPPVTT